MFLHYLLRPLLYALAYLPFWALYWVSDVLFVVMYYVIGYRRRVVMSNLRRAFPEKSPHEIHSIARRYYRWFADMLLETLKLLTISPEEMKRRCSVRNPEVVQAFAQQQRSFFLVLGHYASWEWASPGYALHTGIHTLVIYRPLRSKFFDDLIRYMRTRFGQEATSMKNTLRNILRLKGTVSTTAFIGDQRPENPRDAYWTIFLGQETGFLWGTEKLSQKLDVPVVFAAIHRLRRGYYEIAFETITEQPRSQPEGSITQAFATRLEAQIRANPAYWLWSHNRWKHPRPTAQNPQE